MQEGRFFMSVDSSGDFTDLIYVSEVISPNSLTDQEYSEVINDQIYTIGSIPTK